MAPRATILVLSHRPKLVGRALASALAQTERCEVLVTHAADAYGDKLNRLASIARGEWVFPLCDDDLLHPEYVAKCLRWADEGDMIFSDRRMWWSGMVEAFNWRSWVKRTPRLGHYHRMFGKQLPAVMERDGGQAIRVEVPWQSFIVGAPFPMTCGIRRTLWQELQGYDETMPHADTEFWFRAIRRGSRVVYVPEPLFFYRFHRGQFSRNAPADMTNGQAALAFHRKHFMDFGCAFTPRADDPTLSDCTIIPESERAEYVRRHGMRVA